MENINWYPGHMKKTRELIQENLKMVDLVAEVIDARIPVSSRNPIIEELTEHKARIVVFNKSDLADRSESEKWMAFLRKQGSPAAAVNAMSGGGVSALMKLLTEIDQEKNRQRQRQKPLRLMVAGVPNVGKSSLINRLTGRKSTQTGDRPGVTRGKQWLSLSNGMQLLDTPGILWPKFQDPREGLNLAFCGSIKDEVMNLEELALELIRVLSDSYPQLLAARYKLEALGETPLETMEAIAARRGFLLSGKRVDYLRTARTVLDEFRSGAIGPITLERCEDMAEAAVKI
ncbi:MAG: ribosome biogenesis GTPase YlqF [Bacillota bacterium]|nr:ribosome biogenesis GTPase YlqF [Bacillota bacterium]